MSRWAINTKINTYWTVEYELHEDNSVTIIGHYNDGRPGPKNLAQRYVLEEIDLRTQGGSNRHCVNLEIYAPGSVNWERGELISTHPIRNDSGVFSYSGKPQVKADESTDGV